MNRIPVIALVLAACCALLLAGCSNQPGAASQQQAPDYYDVEITGAEMAADSYGESAVVIAFEFTNKTKTAISFAQAVTTDATQDGAGLYENERVEGYTGSDGVTPDNALNVNPGETATVHKAFYATSTNEVTVRCAVGFADGGFPNARIILAEKTIQPQ